MTRCLAILIALAGTAAAQEPRPKPAKPEKKKVEPEKARKGPPPGVRGAGQDDDERGGPPEGVPPPAARGFRLAQFIRMAKANGLDGEALAAAIQVERARLGLGGDDEDDD